MSKMDVKQLLIDALETFGHPVRLQGSISSDEEYPDSFFTFWNNSTISNAFFDNENTKTIWDFDLNFYSSDVTKVNDILPEVKKLLEKKGFIVGGKGYDVLSDEPSHTGRGVNLIFIEREDKL